jgi:hypothetical protein
MILAVLLLGACGSKGKDKEFNESKAFAMWFLPTTGRYRFLLGFQVVLLEGSIKWSGEVAFLPQTARTYA